MSKNLNLAKIFYRWADILDLKGDNPFHIRAYRQAAKVLEDLKEDIEEVIKSNKKLPGIGVSLRKKIIEYLETGKIKDFEKLKEEFPPSLFELFEIPGLGPKTIKLLYERLNVKSIEDLEKALKEGKLLRLPSFGLKKVEKIKKGLEIYKISRDKIPLGFALQIANFIIDSLKRNLKDVITNISYAGSTRRMKETVGDIDILVTVKNKKFGDKVNEEFKNLEIVKEVLWEGPTRTSILTKDGVQVDLRIIEKKSWGAALQYFTGSKAHNIALRKICLEKGYKLNEYGLYKDDKLVASENEEEIYLTLGLYPPPPELRENLGELTEAERIFEKYIQPILNKENLSLLDAYNLLKESLKADESLRKEISFENLVRIKDIKGDLHVHSKYSDGANTLEEILKAALDFGYEYIGIADHSKSLKVANGLSEEEVRKRNYEIDKLNEKIGKKVLLKVMEVDILPDGSLDYSEDILKDLDIVIAAIHTRFNQDNTERLLRAIENKYVNIIAHPSGRIINQRPSYDVDWDRVFKAAFENNVALEINAYFNRLDLNDTLAYKAYKEYNCKFAINTDSHFIDQFWMISLGVGQARRAWLPKEAIINTYSLDELLKWSQLKR